MDILLIDSYDSFTFNLADLLRKSIPDAVVHVVHNDDFTLPQLTALLPHFQAVVVGPGPGSPSDPGAVGFIPELWRLPESQVLPILGVCLGHQSLCLNFGGELHRLKDVKHGQCSSLMHEGQDIFGGVSDASVVRYHSLHVELPSQYETGLIPLAWAIDNHSDGSQTKVCMAARHSQRPYWGIQYHPESICTSGGGELVIRNFWKLATLWNIKHRSAVRIAPPPGWRSQGSSCNDLHPLPFCVADPLGLKTLVRFTSVGLRSSITIPKICEALPSGEEEFIVLDSSAAPGRFSIVGLISKNTPRISHVVGDAFATVTCGTETAIHPFESAQDIWQWLAEYMDKRKVTGGPPGSPFWGGLIGYANYEAGVATLGISIDARQTHSSRRPDINFAFVQRSIVIDQSEGVVHIQTIVPGDKDLEAEWIARTVSILNAISEPSFTPAPSPMPTDPSMLSKPKRHAALSRKIEFPNESRYLERIAATKDYLLSGDSYEICLTALTRIILSPITTSPSSESRAWRLFKILRALNPAPYGTYLHLGGTTLVGSSPERFLSWTRDGLCQLRPIKGTIKKARQGLPDVTFQEAEEQLLGSAKEIAENLMIVDLIRHDLHRVVSAQANPGVRDHSSIHHDGSTGQVNVAKLFAVEEYETVFQLVSVIEGRVDTRQGYTGWDVLARSLPPGSMTGAPKKRSVELLQKLESKVESSVSFPTQRGVYSGICGYWCAGGAGDFSVVIRSAFRYDDETSSKLETGNEGEETWYIGAGGAITALSDPRDEWEEMKTKLSSTLRAFDSL